MQNYKSLSNNQLNFQHFFSDEVRRIFSLVVAVICALLGILQFLRGVGIMAFFYNGPGISGGIMYVLYGSLAAYFGIKDTIDIGTLLRTRRS